MASFNSGVLITKQTSDRQRADERRQRGQDVPAFCGAVMSRRQHRPTRRDEGDQEGKEQAEALPMDLSKVVSKKPKERLKWLQKALQLAGKGHVKASSFYDIVAHQKFVAGASQDTGSQMRDLMLANLHLFSTKQQRFLESKRSQLSAFAAGRVGESSDEGSSAERPAGANGTSGGAGGGTNRRRRSRSRSHTRSQSRSRSRSGRWREGRQTRVETSGIDAATGRGPAHAERSEEFAGEAARPGGPAPPRRVESSDPVANKVFGALKMSWKGK